MVRTEFEMHTTDGTLRIEMNNNGGPAGYYVIIESKGYGDIRIPAGGSFARAKEIIGRLSRLCQSFVICDEVSPENK